MWLSVDSPPPSPSWYDKINEYVSVIGSVEIDQNDTEITVLNPTETSNIAPKFQINNSEILSQGPNFELFCDTIPEKLWMVGINWEKDGKIESWQQ